MSLINAKDKFSKYFDVSAPDYPGDIVTTGDQARTDGEARVIAAWTEALRQKLPGISPASTTATAAADAFEAAYDGATLASFQAAMSAMAVSIGSGMTGYTPTPPAAPFLPATTTDVIDTLCQELDSQLDAWLGTGSSTLIAPPFTVEPWT